MLNKILAILGAIIVLASLLTAYHTFDTRIAKAEDIRQLQRSIQKMGQRIDRNSDMDAARDMQRRIWDLEAHYRLNPPMPPTVKREIDCLKRDREVLLKKWEGKR